MTLSKKVCQFVKISIYSIPLSSLIVFRREIAKLGEGGGKMPPQSFQVGKKPSPNTVNMKLAKCPGLASLKQNNTFAIIAKICY